MLPAYQDTLKTAFGHEKGSMMHAVHREFIHTTTPTAYSSPFFPANRGHFSLCFWKKNE